MSACLLLCFPGTKSTDRCAISKEKQGLRCVVFMCDVLICVNEIIKCLGVWGCNVCVVPCICCVWVFEEGSS